MSNLERTRAYLRSFSLRDGSTAGYYAPEVVQQELPNLLVPAGATRDLAALQQGLAAGAKSTSDETYEVLNLVEMGDLVAVEARWSARVNVPFGKLAAGDRMTAHLAMFIEWRDGRVIAQRNYDCFEPFR
jgi:ketosteroid isomerase-like protein